MNEGQPPNKMSPEHKPPGPDSKPDWLSDNDWEQLQAAKNSGTNGVSGQRGYVVNNQGGVDEIEIEASPSILPFGDTEPVETPILSPRHLITPNEEKEPLADGKSEFQKNFEILKSSKATGEEREKAKREIERMTGEAEAEGLFDVARQRIHIVAQNSQWKDIEGNIAALANDIEERANYTDHPEMKGIVGQAIRNSAYSLGFESLMRMDAEERRSLGVTDEALDRRNRKIDDQFFWSSGLSTDEVGKRLASAENKVGDDLILNREFPADREQQLFWVRGLLNHIESIGQDVEAIVNADYLKRLNDYKERMSPEVLEEVTLRLDLHSTYLEMRGAAAKGGSEKREGVDVNLFSEAIKNLRSVNRMFDEADLVTIKKDQLGTGENKIPVGEAFLLLGEAALKGRMVEVAGKEGVYRYYDIFNTTKFHQDEIKEAIIKDLQDNNNISKSMAEKAFELAEKTAWATGEIAVWDLSIIHPLARAIHLRGFREGKGPEEDRGPEYTIDKIESVGTSLLRASEVKDASGQKGWLYEPNELKIQSDEERRDRHKTKSFQAKAKPGQEYEVELTTAEEKLLKRRRGFVREGEGYAVDIRKLPVDRLQNDAVFRYWTFTVPQMMDLAKTLTKSVWKPEEVDYDAVERYVNLIKNCSLDKAEKNRISEVFVTGIGKTIFGERQNWSLLYRLPIINVIFPVPVPQEWHVSAANKWTPHKWWQTLDFTIKKGLLDETSARRVALEVGMMEFSGEVGLYYAGTEADINKRY